MRQVHATDAEGVVEIRFAGGDGPAGRGELPDAGIGVKRGIDAIDAEGKAVVHRRGGERGGVLQIKGAGAGGGIVEPDELTLVVRLDDDGEVLSSVG